LALGAPQSMKDVIITLYQFASVPFSDALAGDCRIVP
jgi:hypothetical protein